MGGRGPPGRLGSTGGRAGRDVPMPWEGANGLLPGRGVPVRRCWPALGRPPLEPGRGRGPGCPGCADCPGCVDGPAWPGCPGCAGRVGAGRPGWSGRPGPSDRDGCSVRAAGACWPGARGTDPGRGAPGRGPAGRPLVRSPTGADWAAAPWPLPKGASGAGAGAWVEIGAGLLSSAVAGAEATLGPAGASTGVGAAVAGAAGFAGASGTFRAVFFAGGGSLASFSLSRRSTGASTVEEADRTNSPMSFSMLRTVLLSTPSSFASS